MATSNCLTNHDEIYDAVFKELRVLLVTRGTYDFKRELVLLLAPFRPILSDKKMLFNHSSSVLWIVPPEQVPKRIKFDVVLKWR